MTEDEINRIWEVFVRPFRYDNDAQMIFDNVGQRVVDIRAWGYLQYISDGAKIQDDFGQLITNLLNGEVVVQHYSPK